LSLRPGAVAPDAVAPDRVMPDAVAPDAVAPDPVLAAPVAPAGALPETSSQRGDLARSAKGVLQGGYVLWDSRAQEDADLQLLIIATGTEVHPALQAGRMLAGEGLSVRVVSMPCLELFEAQPKDYQDSVLPQYVKARIAVEAAASISWWKLVGRRGEVVGIDHFGASAPGGVLLQKFGFTTEAIAERARALHQRVCAGDSS
jgi:transketolase